MENEVYVTGKYISGIVKRHDLVNQPCVLICQEDGLILSVLSGEKAETFEFPYSNIDEIICNDRVLVSETTDLEVNDPRTYEHLLSFGLLGVRGLAITKTAELSNQAFNNSIGKIDYSNIQELIVEYHTEEGKRRLLINTNSDSKELIGYFNNIKK